MANAIAPSASFHYVMMGIKDASLDEDKYAAPLVGIRQTDFEDGNEIETETDEGHTGVSNIDMGSYRTTAESSPNWTDALRYGEGLEDMFYLILGKYTKTAHTESSSTVAGVYDYAFTQDLEDTTSELPLATIYNGFAKTTTDARAFNNAMLNEVEFTFNSDELPKINPTFVSDYNTFNLLNPTRTFLTDYKKRFVKAPQTTIYLGEVGATAEEMLANPVDCYTESSFTINHNAESQACHGDDFGKNTKIMGARETTGSITMPWTDASKYLETEYEGYEKYSHVVSDEITNKQIWYKCEGGNIIYNDTETGVPYSTLIKFPEVEITSVTSPKSGTDAKDLTMEYNVLEKPAQSYMTVNIVTDLSALHIDSTGVAFDTLLPTDPPFDEETETETQSSP